MITATVWYRNIPDQILENVTRINTINDKAVKITFVENGKEEATVVYLDDQTTVILDTDL